MKTLSISAVILFSIFTAIPSFAQKSVVNETMKVWGNCGMCKKTIERSAKSAGAITATWNEETKQMSVSYNSTKTSNTKIQRAIAKAGYDTRDLTADNIAYDKLHACCQYERKEAMGINPITKACCDSETCSKDVNTCKEMVDCKGKECCKM